MVFFEKDPTLKQLYESEWRTGVGHPCVLYGEYKLNEIKRQREMDNELINDAINKMSSVPIKRPERPTYTTKYTSPKMPTFPRRNTKRIVKKIITVIAILIVLYLIYANQNSILSSSPSQYAINLFKNYLSIDLSGNFVLLILGFLSLVSILFFVSRTAAKVIIITLIAVFLVIFLVDLFRPSIQSIGSGIGQVEEQVGIKPKINTSQLELDIHNLVNSERQSNGLSALQFDSKLSDIARAHSIDMSLNNYFSHINLKGQDPTARGNAAGYSCFKSYGSYYTNGLAENIFENNLYDSVTYVNGIPIYSWNSQSELASSTVSGWMSSYGHRQNILTSTYDREGIGIAISSDDKVYITQDFC